MYKCLQSTEGASDLLELELQMVLSFHVSASNSTPDFLEEQFRSLIY